MFVTPAYTADAEPAPDTNSSAIQVTPDIEPTVVGFDDFEDPLITFNRAMFAFNDVSYRYVLIPLSRGYQSVIPQPVKTSVGNFFYNVKTPIYAVNNLAQGKWEDSGVNVSRFLINSTLGIAGLFDPAYHWFDLERRFTGSEQTLTTWGVGDGPYLVLPFFGSTNLRGAGGRVVDYFLNPMAQFVGSPDAQALISFDFFQDYSSNADRYLILRDQAIDPYLFFRNLYLQSVQRDAEFPATQ